MNTHTAVFSFLRTTGKKKLRQRRTTTFFLNGRPRVGSGKSFDIPQKKLRIFACGFAVTHCNTCARNIDFLTKNRLLEKMIDVGGW